VKQVVILSGKGGTGKTTVAAALAHLASQEMTVVLADADVDAANLELVLEPLNQQEHDFMGAHSAVVDPDRCQLCGICADVCRFGAVIVGDGVYSVDPLACEGCAACFYQCPEAAIRMEQRQGGVWFRSDTRFGPLFHLFAGEENSGKLVTLVKQEAREISLSAGAELLLVDGPPGIGCPVISAVTGADAALLVVEPTISGEHDLARVLATTSHFNVPALVIVNKADLNPARADQIAAFCDAEEVEVVGRIPYDTIVTEAMVEGLPVTTHSSHPVTRALQEIWQRVKGHLLDEAAEETGA
jgi:MinD superfamily P-loop ATPase